MIIFIISFMGIVPLGIGVVLFLWTKDMDDKPQQNEDNYVGEIKE